MILSNHSFNTLALFLYFLISSHHTCAVPVFNHNLTVFSRYPINEALRKKDPAPLFPEVNMDGFSKYTLDTIFRNSQVDVTPNSFTELPDGSLVIVSVIRYAKDFEYSAVQNEKDIPTDEQIDRSRYAAFVFRTVDGSVSWAKRTALVAYESRPHFEIISDDRYVYVVGTADDLSSSSIAGARRNNVGMIFRYDFSGESYLSRKFGGHGFRFTKPLFSGRSLIVGCQAPITSTPFAFYKMDRVPKTEGICITRINPDDLHVSVIQPITPGTFPDGSQIERDEWTDMTFSNNRRVVFVEARQTRKQVTKPVVYKVNLNDLTVLLGPAEQEDSLDALTKLSTAPDGSLVRAYIMHNEGKEGLVMRRLSSDLQPQKWIHNTNLALRRRIYIDTRLSPSIRHSTLRAIHIDNRGAIRILVHTAENLLHRPKSPTKLVRDIPKSSLLDNGRPGMMVFRDSGEEVYAVQVNNSRNVNPVAMMSSRKRGLMYILGKEGNGFVLTSAKRLAIAEFTSDPDIIAPSPTAEETEKECFSTDSVVNGQKAVDVVRAHPQLRLQRHPMRANSKVAMLCYQHKDSQFCATMHHILRVKGESVYMYQFCSQQGGCDLRMKEPINFKGPCGTDINAGKVGITMHTGGAKIAADHAVKKECIQRDTTWLAWFMRTL